MKNAKNWIIAVLAIAAAVMLSLFIYTNSQKGQTEQKLNDLQKSWQVAQDDIARLTQEKEAAAAETAEVQKQLDTALQEKGALQESVVQMESDKEVMAQQLEKMTALIQGLAEAIGIDIGAMDPEAPAEEPAEPAEETEATPAEEPADAAAETEEPAPTEEPAEPAAETGEASAEEPAEPAAETEEPAPAEEPAEAAAETTKADGE